MFPWNDRAGRLSALKSAVFALTLLPALWLAAQASAGWLGSKPLTEAIHQSGDWSVRFLLLSLAITPLRFVAQWPDLIQVRRMLGLTALAYALVHLGLYVALESFDLQKVASEIILRLYLTIGFAALIGLSALGVTSTDSMIRRLGSVGWNRLHSIVYGLAILTLAHFAMQSKLDITQAALMTGFFLWLMGFRALRRFRIRTAAPILVALAIATGLLTMLVEAGWYGAMTGISGWRVLSANLDFSYVVRPGWWVMLAGAAMAGLGFIRARTASESGRRSGLSGGRLASASASQQEIKISVRR